MNGERFGKFHQVYKYNNPVLENQRITSQPFSFSYEVWLYIDDYCKEWKFCALYQRYDYGLRKYTPNIFFTSEGQIHIEVVDRTGKITGATTIVKVPKDEWCRLVIRFGTSWQVFINCKSNFANTLKAEFVMSTNVAYNDVDCVGSIGGSSMTATFNGYIGKFTFYRRKLIEPSQLRLVDEKDFMFYLGKQRWQQICSNHMETIEYALKRTRVRTQRYIIMAIKSYYYYY
jgi:hypothetical protein